MHCAQRLQLSEIIVAVAHKNIDLHDVLHLPVDRFDDRLEIAKRLFVLSYEVTWRDNATLSIATGLTGQEGPLQDGPWEDFDPTWSPDGSRILFVRAKPVATPLGTGLEARTIAAVPATRLWTLPGLSECAAFPAFAVRVARASVATAPEMITLNRTIGPPCGIVAY